MKALGSALSLTMRVLSPSRLPPDRALDGSIVSTATRCPRAVRKLPKASISALLPAPGDAGQRRS